MINKDEYEWGMLWISSQKDVFKMLDEAIEYFKGKIGCDPSKILVNKSIDIKDYKTIPVRKDSQMYDTKLIFMIIP
jgi:hypothetical protein